MPGIRHTHRAWVDADDSCCCTLMHAQGSLESPCSTGGQEVAVPLSQQGNTIGLADSNACYMLGSGLSWVFHQPSTSTIMSYWSRHGHVQLQNSACHQHTCCQHAIVQHTPETAVLTHVSDAVNTDMSSTVLLVRPGWCLRVCSDAFERGSMSTHVGLKAGINRCCHVCLPTCGSVCRHARRLAAAAPQLVVPERCSGPAHGADPSRLTSSIH